MRQASVRPVPFRTVPTLLCSVCFGDPASPLTKGTLAGVLFLMAVVGFVLAWIGVTAWIWGRRAKRLTPLA